MRHQGNGCICSLKIIGTIADLLTVVVAMAALIGGGDDSDAT